MAARLCLRWNKFPGTLAEEFDLLRHEREFVDVTLACREGQDFSAHKVVLSACSPYFRVLLNKIPCQHPVIFLKDVRPEEMEALLQFMYTGQTSICQNKLAVLLQAAAALQIKGLAEVSGLSYDDLERGDVGTTETATCTQQVVGEARNTGRKPVPLKNDTTRRDGSSEPTTKKRKQLPVLQVKSFSSGS
ncbi:unnamed protein product, partial [Notodromas monacha]